MIASDAAAVRERLAAHGSAELVALARAEHAVTGEFYRRYGDLLTLPMQDVRASEPRFPDGSDPNTQQLSAVDTILGNRLSYIWGAPGTGKTQYVLATCIRAMVESGCRVAVFAPTNNSVEQVLRGVIKAFGEDEALIRSIL